MIKKDFLKAIASKTDISMAKVEQILDAVFETITKLLSKGDEIAFTDFGKFKVVKHAARKGRNPQTGEALKIQARKVVKFVVGKKLKETVGRK